MAWFYLKGRAMNDLTQEQRKALAAGVDKVLMPLVRGVLVEKLSQVAAFMRDELTTPPAWDASQVKQPGWNHVQQAFIDGAREARTNPTATEDDFGRASDGYTKRVFEEVDPASEAALRTESWKTPAGVLPVEAPSAPTEGKCGHCGMKVRLRWTHERDDTRCADLAHIAHVVGVPACAPVPLEPTQAMLDAADKVLDADPRFIAAAWRAMVAASGVALPAATPFSEAKATIMALPEQDVRALAIAQFIQLQTHEKYGNTMQNLNAAYRAEQAGALGVPVCPTCGGTKVDPGGLPICRTCGVALPRADQLVEAVAKAIYSQWIAVLGYMPWVEGGNSFKQDDARRLAREAIDGVALPAAPQPTDEQLEALYHKHIGNSWAFTEPQRRYARAILALADGVNASGDLDRIRVLHEQARKDRAASAVTGAPQGLVAPDSPGVAPPPVQTQAPSHADGPSAPKTGES
jgi:hypothetical protein